MWSRSTVSVLVDRFSENVFAVSFSQEHSAFIVKHYFLYRSYAIVQHFRNALPNVQVPQKSTIKRIIDLFRTYHTTDNLPKARRPSLYTEENVEKVVSKFEQNPSILIRWATAVSSISKTTTYNIVRKFELKPFHFSILQELKPNDLAKRLAFCAWFERFIDDRYDVLDTTFFTDEVWFHLAGYVNAQKFPYIV